MRSILFSIVACFGLHSADARMGPFCEELMSIDAAEVPGYAYVKEVCFSQFDTYSGSFVFVERGFIPIPKIFYYKIPNEQEISLSSAQTIRSSEDINSPFGILNISSKERAQSQRSEVTSENEIEHAVLELLGERCDLPVKAIQYKKGWVSSDFEENFYEMQLGDTALVASGEARALLLAMADAYTRLNCSEPNGN